MHWPELAPVTELTMREETDVTGVLRCFSVFCLLFTPPEEQARRMGEHFGAVHLPNHCLCPPNKKCAPSKRGLCPKITGSVPLECSSGPETPKILIINPVFVGKNSFFADFAMKTFFYGLHSRIRGKVFVPLQKLFMSPHSRYSGAGPTKEPIWGKQSVVGYLNYLKFLTELPV